jgi:hypothetical protein
VFRDIGEVLKARLVYWMMKLVQWRGEDGLIVFGGNRTTEPARVTVLVRSHPMLLVETRSQVIRMERKSSPIIKPGTVDCNKGRFQKNTMFIR